MNRVRELRKKNNISQEKLSKMLNTTQSNISGWESDKWQPDNDNLIKMSNIFNCSLDYLLGRDNTEQTKKTGIVKIPVYGTIPAGIPTEMIDESYIEDYEEINEEMLKGGHAYFGLKVKGDSMYPEFRNDDTLILKKQDDCENGDYCAVSINHTESTFKKVIKHSNGITLQPINPTYEPIFFSNQEVIDLPITILGVIKEVRRSY